MKLKFKIGKIIFLIVLLLLSTNAKSQIDPGVDFDLNGYINSRLDAGETTIVVPSGRYRVQPIGSTHLLFENRDNVTIIADNVEMICTEHVPAIKINNCNNFKLQGLSVDYDPLPFTQGVIVDISQDKTTITADLIDGYPSNLSGNKLEIFDPVTGELSTLTYYGFTYNYDANAKRVVITKTNVGNNHTESVGDIIVMSARTTNIPHAIRPQNCRGLVLENVTLYASTSFGFFEDYCDGTKYINCRVIRRPLETDTKERGIRRMRSTNADALHSKHAKVGPSYVGCETAYNGDDGIIIAGVSDLVLESNGNVLTVVGWGGNEPFLDVGDVIEITDYSGIRIPNATISDIQVGRKVTPEEIAWIDSQQFYGLAANAADPSTDVYNITIDRSVDLPRGSVVNSANKVGNGFEIRNCTVGHNRSRGLFIKAGNGIITGNTLAGSWIKAIMVAPEYKWLGAASGSNILITDNIITDTHDLSIGVFSTGGDGSISPAGAHDNITITGNTITNSTNPAIVVTSTINLCMENNTIESTDNSLYVNNNLWGRNTNLGRDTYTENVEYSDCSITMVGLRLDPIYKSVYTNNTVQLTATIVPEEFPNPGLVWSSSNPSVATVDQNGLVTAVSNGEADITVATIDGAFPTTCAIKVDDNNIQFPDAITSVSGPTTVNQGATVVVNVPYTASTTRDIVVNFQENGVDINGDNNNFTNFGSTRTTVLAGAGTLLVNIATSASTPISSGYRYAVFLTTVDGGFAERLASGTPMTGVSVTAPLSTSTFENQMYSVYPNPADGFIHVEIPNASFSNVQFRLYDLLGKLVFEEQDATGKDKWQIEVRGLAKGIHILEITADDQVVYHKVAKK